QVFGIMHSVAAVNFDRRFIPRASGDNVFLPQRGVLLKGEKFDTVFQGGLNGLIELHGKGFGFQRVGEGKVKIKRAVSREVETEEMKKLLLRDAVAILGLYQSRPGAGQFDLRTENAETRLQIIVESMAHILELLFGEFNRGARNADFLFRSENIRVSDP